MIKYIIIILVIILYKKKIFSKGKHVYVKNVHNKFSCSTIAVYLLLYYFKPFREFCLNN